MNEIMERQNNTAGTAIAPYDDDPFTQFANDVGQRSIVGSLLKFSKGDWLVGETNDEVPLGTQFVANMGELLRGWVRWADNKPTDHVMGKVMMRYQPPRRSELGDLDKSQWEVDDKGNERDPWQETYYLLLMGTGDDHGELYTYAASSKGGRDAIAELCKEYSKGKRKQKGEMYPVVALGSDSYPHPKKEYGRIKTPVLKIVGWVATSVFDDIGTADDEQIDPETGEVMTATATATATTANKSKNQAAPKADKADSTKTDSKPRF
ncbi:hypothetical protein [Bradyrhizobium neotropicale]|uniref:hypothetical protein n=1 Tax=Bradyrhizobium neotropicale TaxID=1497615 RepID=UPI001AD6A1C9|nr:hypothetical protein [Bradyrhizobium neotropicale]MBO4228150.1 hypothetical protein [Bradyrhizobium neotropicale]